MRKKYKFTGKTKRVNGHTLHQIVATKSFGGVCKGDIGGWIESEDNLCHTGNCWVYGNAVVYASALVGGDASVTENARISGRARIYDNAVVSGNARVYDKAIVHNQARILWQAKVHGTAIISGKAHVSSFAIVYGHAYITDNAWVQEVAVIRDRAVISGDAWVSGRSLVCGDACVRGGACVEGNSIVCGRAKVEGKAQLTGNAVVSQNMTINRPVEVAVDLTDPKNIGANLLAQTGLVPCGDTVTAYKQVRKDLRSFCDYSYKYTVGTWAEPKGKAEESMESCAAGLHFSSADYWTLNQPTTKSTFLIADIKLEDIITIQDGKIRCRKAFIKGQFDI